MSAHEPSFDSLIHCIPQGCGLIIFDSNCALCDQSVRFLIKHDPGKKLYFTSFGANILDEIYSDHIMEREFPPAIVLVSEKGVFSGYRAVEQIATMVCISSFLLKVLRYTPYIIKNMVYQFIARYRFLIFGKTARCFMPNPEEVTRFL